MEAELAELRTQVTELQNSTVLTSGNVSEFFTAFNAASGMHVTPESAMRLSSVYACVALIAGAISVLPCNVYRRTPQAREQVDHDVWWLLNETPYPTVTSLSFWEWIIASKLLRADGVAQIVRNRAGQPKYFMPLPRECVLIEKVGDRNRFYVNDGISRYGLDQDDVLHFPGFCGLSVIGHAAKNAIGTGLAADAFSGGFFKNGLVPSSVVTYPQGVAPTKDQQEFLRTQLEQRAGNGNHHKPLLLVNGGKLESVTMTAEDAQLLETRKFQVIDIARAFGVPPHMIGETSASTTWGSGVEQMSIGFVRYTLGPHLTQIQQELNRKLWPRSATYFVEFNREALLAGDSKSEAEYFSKALGGPGAQGWMSVNEVRRVKNLPPDPNFTGVVKAGAAPTEESNDEPPATDAE